MPPLVAGITAAAVVKAIVGAVLSFAISFLIRALSGKPDQPDLPPFEFEDPERTQTIRSNVGTRRAIVGEAKIGGYLSFYESTEENRYHHLVVTLCNGPIEKIGTVWLGDRPVHADQLDGSGNVVSGEFAGKVRIKKHLGATDQAADADLISEVSALDSNFRGRGIAYVYVRVDWDRELFPQGLPNVAAEIKGLQLYDPRDAGTRWSPNPALAIRALLTDTDWGYSEDSSRITDSYLNAAANTCEEIVDSEEVDTEVASVDTGADSLVLSGETLKYQTGDRVEVSSTGSVPAGLAAATGYYVIVVKRAQDPEIQLASSYDNALAETQITITDTGSGTITVTKTGEPRFTANGAIDTKESLGVHLEGLRRAMEGYAAPPGGEWRIQAGEWAAPDVTLTEDDIITPVTVVTRHPRRERFNGVRGTYVSPLNDWQEGDYPVLQSSTYKTADNGEDLYQTVDRPFTSRAQTCQRLAKIALERHRQELTIEATFNLKAFQVQPGGNVWIVHELFGWTGSGKAFECVAWQPVPMEDRSGNPFIGIRMTLRETAAAIYTFSHATEEFVVDPAPNTNLPSAFNVGVPSQLAIITEEVDGRPRAVLSWKKPNDRLVAGAGKFQAQFRRSLGRGISFDHQNDLVTIAKVLDLNDLDDDGTEEKTFTFEFWAKYDGVASGSDELIFENDQLEIYRRDSDDLILVVLDDGSSTYTMTSTTVMATAAWLHIAVTWDGSTARLYINAAQEDTVAVSTSLTTPIAGVFADALTGFDYWGGVIDEVRLWRVERSLAELQLWRDQVLDEISDDLVLYWPMDGLITGYVFDQTPNKNYGTVDGATYADGKLVPKFESTFEVEGGESRVYVTPVEDGKAYDFRLRSISQLGIPSAWTQVLSYTIGSPGAGASAQSDWGTFSDSVTNSEDWGSFDTSGDPVSNSEDWGAFS